MTMELLSLSRVNKAPETVHSSYIRINKLTLRSMLVQMSFPLYLLLFIASTLPALIIGFMRVPKREVHTTSYNEGLRNENDGHYDLALHNYETALRQIVKSRPGKKIIEKISHRIRILRTIIDYEKNFRTGNQV